MKQRVEELLRIYSDKPNKSPNDILLIEDLKLVLVGIETDNLNEFDILRVEHRLGEKL